MAQARRGWRVEKIPDRTVQSKNAVAHAHEKLSRTYEVLDQGRPFHAKLMNPAPLRFRITAQKEAISPNDIVPARTGRVLLD